MGSASSQVQHWQVVSCGCSFGKDDRFVAGAGASPAQILFRSKATLWRIRRYNYFASRWRKLLPHILYMRLGRSRIIFHMSQNQKSRLWMWNAYFNNELETRPSISITSLVNNLPSSFEWRPLDCRNIFQYRGKRTPLVSKKKFANCLFQSHTKILRKRCIHLITKHPKNRCIKNKSWHLKQKISWLHISTLSMIYTTLFSEGLTRSWSLSRWPADEKMRC